MTIHCELTVVSGSLTLALAQMFALYVQRDTQLVLSGPDS